MRRQPWILSSLVPELMGVLTLLLLSLPGLAMGGDLVCGVASEIPGFTARDSAGRYQGFEVEFCRAVAMARYGSPEAVKFVAVPDLAQFVAVPERRNAPDPETLEREPRIDLVVGGLTATAARESDARVRFGPVYFHDGQHFVVRKDRHIADQRALGGKSICVTTETRAAATLERAFAERRLALDVHLFDSDTLAWAAFERGECEVYSADIVEIVKGLAASSHCEDYAVLPGRISEEPLAPVLHENDAALMELVRRTLQSWIDAEGSGSAAKDAPGNYGEIYDRTLGRESRFRVPRAENHLVRNGGLIALPPD